MTTLGPQRTIVGLLLVAALAALVLPTPLWAADPKPGPPLTIQRAAGPINVDGDMSDPGWQGIAPDTTWFETRVGDNVPPQVHNAGYLAYDDSYFYAGFVFEDPQAGAVRAPLGDHDQLGGSTDYAGVIIDTHNDGKTAQMFLANPRGLQYDALTNDATGEDSSPDFFWDAAGKITDTGWSLEIRIPFTSLRYADTAQPTWGILLYRNYPRDRRYQFFTARLPRDVNCFICNSSKLTGLANLPRGSHMVVAPFTTASQIDQPPGGPPGLGLPLESGDFKTKAGADIKWSPFSSLQVDGTVNPDFSQVESDVAQIVANERFALFFPEKRPFFLEGVDLFSTPLSAIYTRTINSPRGGVRATGRVGSNSYTALYAQDRGDGLVTIPGPQGSDFAFQDFISDAGVLRVRHDIGQSYLSMLASAREIHDDGGGGSNRVIGPDFQWRPNPRDNVTGQYLWSATRTPNRTDLWPDWDGRSLDAGAGLLYWAHGTRHEDWFLQVQQYGNDFRDDNGFIPQVGYREAFLDAGYTIRPTKGFFNRMRFFTTNYYDEDSDHNLLNRRVSVGSGADGRWNSFVRLELNQEAVRSGTRTFERFRPRLQLQASPSRVFNQFNFDMLFGQEIDFANARRGNGVSLSGNGTIRPGNHIELRGDVSRRWLNVNDPVLGSGRLFTAQVERLRATYTFNSRAFLRLIGQYQETRRNQALYDPAIFVSGPPRRRTASINGSALVAYKLNWQTVLYAGYGDEHDYYAPADDFKPMNRQFFAKASYAWQH